MAKVKCENCGFLTAISLVDGSCVSIMLDGRKQGTVPLIPVINNRRLHAYIPLCFVGAQDLATPDIREDYLRKIREERDCGQFAQWVPGHSPKEHVEMMQEKQMLEWQEERRREDREFQQAQRREAEAAQERKDSDQRSWQAKAKEDDRKWQLAQKRSDRKWQLVWIVVGATLALLSGFFLKQLDKEAKQSAPTTERAP